MEVISKKLMKKTVFMILFLTFCCLFAATGAGELPKIPKSISEAQWLWCGTREKPAAKAYFRYDFTVDSPVKRAWFYTFLENGGDVWINGQKLRLSLWKPVASYRGHVKGRGAEIAKYLKPGRNVLAIAQKKGKYHGFILRGQIEFENGRKLPFSSSAKYFKTASEASENWKDPDFDDSRWGVPLELGDARSEPWSSYGDTAKIYCSPEEYQRYRMLLAPGFDEKKFLKEPEIPKVRIVYRGITPAVEVNGKLYQPAVLTVGALNPTPATDSMLKAAAKADIPFVILSFSDDEAVTYQKDGYDFSQMDNAVRRVLMLHPKAYLIVGYTTPNPNKYWIKHHPDELVGFAKSFGNKKIHPFWNSDPAPSFASKAYRAEIARVMKLLANYCKKQPWGRRIVAVRTGYGPSNDGMPWGCNCMPDTGKRMTEAFRRYLKEKYRTDAALQKAWADPSVTIENALVPDEQQRHARSRRSPRPETDRLLHLLPPRIRRLHDRLRQGGQRSIPRPSRRRLVGIYDPPVSA